jgi:hypothetical protein
MSNRNSLEIQKLKAELTKATREANWWSALIPGAPQAVALFLVGVGSITVASWSGVLDARHHLLETKRINQENEAKELTGLISDLKKQKEVLTASVKIYKSQMDVVRSVKKFLPATEFHVDPETFSITGVSAEPLSFNVFSADYRGDDSDWLSADKSEEALTEIAKLPEVGRLSLTRMFVDHRGVLKVAEMVGPKELTLDRTDTTSSDLERLFADSSRIRNMSKLSLVALDLGDGLWLQRIPKKFCLRLSGTEVNPTFCENLVKVKSRLNSLWFFECAIPEGVLPKFADAPLESIVLSGARVGDHELSNAEIILRECAGLSKFWILIDGARFPDGGFEKLRSRGEAKGLRFLNFKGPFVGG